MILRSMATLQRSSAPFFPPAKIKLRHCSLPSEFSRPVISCALWEGSFLGGHQGSEFVLCSHYGMIRITRGATPSFTKESF